MRTNALTMGRYITRIERETLLRKANEVWAAHIADPDVRRDAEDAVWEVTLLDGLDNEEWLLLET
jgi:hypothetical protein